MAQNNKSSSSIEETVAHKIVESGERSKIKSLATEKLEESGWTDEIRQICKEFVCTQDPETFTHAELVEAVRSEARLKVPDHVKSDILRQIKDVLQT